MLFDQIAKNKRKTVMLFFGFFLFMGGVGAALGTFLMNGHWQQGIVIAFVVGLVYTVYMLVNRLTLSCQ